MTLTVFGSVPTCKETPKTGRHQQGDRMTEFKTLTYLCMCFASAEIDGLTRS